MLAGVGLGHGGIFQHGLDSPAQRGVSLACINEVRRPFHGISQLFRALEDCIQATHIVIPESMFQGNRLASARLVGGDAHGYLNSNLLSP